MKCKVFSLVAFIFVSCLIFLESPKIKLKHSQAKRIGIILPVDHTAFRSIVSGLGETLNRDYAGEIVISLKSAKGDPNKQRVLIEQLLGESIDVFVPVGFSATQMAIEQVSDKPIVSLAATIDPATRPPNLTGILDEIGTDKLFKYLRAFFPHLKAFTLIHSSSERIYTEVKKLQECANKSGVLLQTFTIQNLNDLDSLASNLNPKSELIFTFKDHLIDSASPALAKVACTLKIPFVSCYEDSVYQGASFAIGVREEEIGSEGAKLILKIIEGQKPYTLDPKKINAHHLFINQQNCQEQGVDIEDLESKANKIGFKTLMVR